MRSFANLPTTPASRSRRHRAEADGSRKPEKSSQVVIPSEGQRGKSNPSLGLGASHLTSDSGVRFVVAGAGKTRPRAGHPRDQGVATDRAARRCGRIAPGRPTASAWLAVIRRPRFRRLRRRFRWQNSTTSHPYSPQVVDQERGAGPDAHARSGGAGAPPTPASSSGGANRPGESAGWHDSGYTGPVSYRPGRARSADRGALTWRRSKS